MGATHAVDLFVECAAAAFANIPMIPRSAGDKEFFPQDWLIDRLVAAGLPFAQQGRNSYPDFWVGDSVVSPIEGIEVKSLAFTRGRPARPEFDSNSTIPANPAWIVWTLPGKGGHVTQLAYVRDFLRDTWRDLTPGDPSEFGGLWFSRKGKGSIFLSGPESKAYGRVVSRLEEEHAPNEDISRSTLGNYLQDALFETLDPRSESRDDAAFRQRLSTAMAELQRKLREPAVAYACYIPVRGVADEGLPTTVGVVRLVRMSATHTRRLVSPAGIQMPAAQIASRRRTLKQMMGDPQGQPMAVVMVQARDFDAARHLSRRKTHQVIDVVNFFADMIPYNQGWAYLPGDAASENTVSPAIRADGELSLAGAWVGPLQPVSLKRLKATPQLRPGFRRTNELLRDAARSPLGEVLLTSVEWAGRASVEPVRQQKFLLFTIALETIMLPEQSSGSIKYRLQLRTAHFLGRTAEARRELFDAVGELYKARGKIAHSGSSAVSEEDLGKLRLIVKWCVLRALVHPQTRRLTQPKDFANWLDSRPLR